jgi:hypothetical protein
MAQEVQYLPSKCEVLGSNPSTTQKQNKTKQKENHTHTKRKRKKVTAV